MELAFSPLASAVILDPPGLKHVSARRYRREMASWVTRDGLYPHETLALIREPVDWLGSWYRYRQRPQVAGEEVSTRGIEFGDFVAAWMEPRPPEFARIGSQARFLSGRRGRLLVDHLFRYEDYDRAVDFLNDRLGTSIRPPRVNLSPKMGLSLPTELQTALEDHAALDFRLWREAGKLAGA